MRSYLVCFIILFTFSVHGQNSKATPPGTLKINDSLYIDKGPVDNVMYREFTNRVLKLWSLTLHDSLKVLELEDIHNSLLSRPLNHLQSVEIYNKITLDESGEINGEVDMYSYLNHPRYNYHPVITVSREKAELFCKWRTDMVNLLWSTKVKDDPENYFKVKYRLPTIAEYELAKTEFKDDDKLVFFNEGSPLEIDLEHLRKKENIFFFNAAEITQAEEDYLNQYFKVDNPDLSKKSFTFFRCICEVQQ